MPTASPHAGPPAGPPAGLRVGDYRLITRIGEGGMGVVHLAQKPGGQRVALKVLRPHVVGDDEARARLAREVNSLSRVRSPRVAEILDADPWAAIPYVATRYVPGLSLHDHVKQEGAIVGDDLRHFAVELSAALDAVHRVGVLHRDVKPSNVLMEGRNPVLIDFGLARVADDPKLTHTGWLLGTPGYLAPEILYGEDATTAADVHALASTIAFAGLGRAPFGRGPAMAVMDRVRRGQHDLTGLDRDLRAVLERALDPEPGRRPTLGELRGWLDPDSHDAATRTRPAVVSPGAGAAAGAAGAAAATAAAAAAAGRPGAAVPPPYRRTVGETTRADEDDEAAAHAATAQLPAIDEPVHGGTKVLPADPPPAVTLPGVPPSTPTMPPQHEPYQQPPPPPARPAPLRPAPTPYAAPRRDPQPPREDQAPVWQPPRQRGAGLRFRSGLLALALGAVVAASAAVAPWVTLAVVGLVAWVLRALSLGGTAHRRRAERRGSRHWADGPLAVVAGPWYLVVAVMGTVALLLWAVVLALSAGLLALALGAREPVVLASAGAVLALAVWTGPGSSRVRGPTLVVADAVSSRSVVWLLFLVLLAGLATAVALAADAGGGADWLPAADAPSAPGDPVDLLRAWWDRLTSWA